MGESVFSQSDVRGLPQGWNCCCVRQATEADWKTEFEVNN